MKIDYKIVSPSLAHDKYIPLLIDRLEQNEEFIRIVGEIRSTYKKITDDLEGIRGSDLPEFDIRHYMKEMNSKIEKLFICFPHISDWKDGIANWIYTETLYLQDVSEPIELRIKTDLPDEYAEYKESDDGEGVKIILKAPLSKGAISDSQLIAWIKHNKKTINKLVEYVPQHNAYQPRRDNFNHDRLVAFLHDKEKMSYPIIIDFLDDELGEVNYLNQLEKCYQDFPLKLKQS